MKISSWNFANVIMSARLPAMQILVSIGTVGASPQMGEILPPCDFLWLSYPVLSCPVLGLTRCYKTKWFFYIYNENNQLASQCYYAPSVLKVFSKMRGFNCWWAIKRLEAASGWSGVRYFWIMLIRMVYSGVLRILFRRVNWFDVKGINIEVGS